MYNNIDLLSFLEWFLGCKPDNITVNVSDNLEQWSLGYNETNSIIISITRNEKTYNLDNKTLYYHNGADTIKIGAIKGITKEISFMYSEIIDDGMVHNARYPHTFDIMCVENVVNCSNRIYSRKYTRGYTRVYR